MASGGQSSGRVWLSSREDGRWVGGGVVGDVMCLAVFGWCFRIVSPSSWGWLRDLGVVSLRGVMKRTVNPCPLHKLPQLFNPPARAVVEDALLELVYEDVGPLVYGDAPVLLLGY